METYAQALLYAIPFFILLVLIEMGYGYFIKDVKYKAMDTISSLSSGLTNIIKDSLGLVVILVSYPYLVENMALMEIKANWAVYVLGFIFLDFGSYWNHRLSHRINFFWNQHVIHHSSEEFNLSCALRQSISNVLGYFPLLLIPAALVGIPHKVIAILAPIHLFAQFWYHTQHIGKLGWLEYIIVTPSQHRVHHAINEEYIDKNLAAIFCVWDRMFGTFQEELKDVPPVYGVLKPANTWNPMIINFQHLYRLGFDAWHAKKFTDKLKLWFMPTGWRPKDVAEKFPRPIIEDPYKQVKFETEASMAFINWNIFRLISTTILMLFMFYNYSEIGFQGLLIYAGIVALGIFGYTSMMDGHRWAFIFEFLGVFFGIFILLRNHDWFGINEYFANAHLILWIYFLIILCGSAYFTLIELSKIQLSKRT